MSELREAVERFERYLPAVEATGEDGTTEYVADVRTLVAAARRLLAIEEQDPELLRRCAIALVEAEPWEWDREPDWLKEQTLQSVRIVLAVIAEKEA